MEAKLPADAPDRGPEKRSAFPFSNWGAGAALVGVLLALGAGLLLSIPVVIVDNPTSADMHQSSSEQHEAGEGLSSAADAAVQFATALGFLFVPFALAATRGADSIREGARRLGLRRFKPSALKLMGAAIGAYLLFTAAYVAIIGEPKQEDIAEGFGAVPVQILLIVIAAPISEEVCFRGMLFGGLRERLPRIAAALVSGGIFGALHALTGISAVPPLIAFGFILALLYEATGSIVPGILLHMLNNSVALLGQ
jgi:membrane protease YdiL (CAAX protease family)